MACFRRQKGDRLNEQQGAHGAVGKFGRGAGSGRLAIAPWGSMNPPSPIVTAIIASEDVSFRLCITAILGARLPEALVTAQAASRAELLSKLRTFGADLLLIDAHLDPPLAQLVLPEVHRISGQTRILVFHDVINHVSVASAIGHHAQGCIRRCPTADELEKAVRLILAGEMWFPRKMLAEALSLALGMTSSPPAQDDQAEHLTLREREIVRCVSAGMTNKEIARDLGISPTTVKTHLHNVFGKRKVGRRLQLLTRQ